MTFIDSFDAKFSSLTSSPTRTASYNTGPTLLSKNTAPTLRPTTLRSHCFRTILRQHCFPTTLHQPSLLQYCANTASYNITLQQYSVKTSSYNNAPALHYTKDLKFTSGCDKTRTQRRILECPARQTKQRFITQGHENQALIMNTRQNEKITKLMFRALSPSSSL